MPFRTLGAYELLEPLGEGGMGAVYRARDTRLDRAVAVKLIRDGSGDHARARFLREAKAAAALNHPNVATVYDAGSENGLDFIAMELVEGGSLLDEIGRAPVAITRAVEILRQIALGLRAAHQAGVIHRDLKPANVLLTAAGEVKIVDFGLARIEAPVSDDTVSLSLTHAGRAIGTPAYMAPEQAAGDRAGARADIFSFGVVAYELLTGVRAFPGNSSLTVIQKVLTGKPEPILRRRPDCPSNLVALVERCLEKSPGDRPASFDEVLAALDTPTPRRPAVRRWIAALAALLLAATLAAVWTVRQRQAASIDSAAALLDRYDRPGNVDRAIELLANDSSPLARARLSLAYSQKFRDDPDPVWIERAESEANSAIRGEPNLAAAHTALGTAAFRAGRLDDAEKSLARALDLNPRDSAATRRLAQVREGQKRLADAETLFRRAVEIAPADWQTHQALAFFLQSRGRYAEARDNYLKALELTPDNYALHRDLGSTYWYLERYDDAASSFQRALELRPSATVSNNLGVALYFRGRYGESAAAFEKAVELGANNYVHWGNLGDAQREVPALKARASESWTRARQLAEERLSREPGDEAAAAGLALYLARLGDKRAALDRAATLEKEPSLKPGTHYLLTLAAEAAGDRPRALRHLELALRAGYGTTEARANPTLVALRSDPAYHRLLAHLEKR